MTDTQLENVIAVVEPVKKASFFHSLFSDSTKEGVGTFIRMVQTGAICLVGFFLLRFTGSVDKLTETIKTVQIDLTRYGTQLEFIKEKVNDNGARLDDIQIDHSKLKNAFEIHQITGK